MTYDPIRLGVIGLGRAFVLMLPTFRADPRVKLTAASAPRTASREAFEAEFGGRSYTSANELCADSEVDAVYIASPHQLHKEHALIAAKAGKHVLVEKPIAVSLKEAHEMVAAFEAAKLQLVVGPSHSFDAPVLKARELIDTGVYGKVRMLHALNCTDFLYRPRRPEELRTEEGGGVLFSQGVHQIDMVRLLCGGLASQVTAMTGAWDPARPTEGAYSALLAFEGGAFASLTYSGYAHFDSDVWQDEISELGYPKQAIGFTGTRDRLSRLETPAEEIEQKKARTFHKDLDRAPAPHHEHFGPVVVFCEHADLRITPHGVHVFGNRENEFHPCAFRHPRAEVIDGLEAAVQRGAPPAQTGAWGLASLEVCHAILESASAGSTVRLHHQIGL